MKCHKLQVVILLVVKLIYREVINNYYNARETLVEYCGNINDEINRKRKEFDLPTLDD